MHTRYKNLEHQKLLVDLKTATRQIKTLTKINKNLSKTLLKDEENINLFLDLIKHAEKLDLTINIVKSEPHRLINDDKA